MQLSRSEYLLSINYWNKHHISAEGLEKTSILTANELSNFPQEQFLIVYDPEGDNSIELKDNIAKTLDYMKKEFDEIPVTQIPEQLSSYENIILAFSQLDKLKELEPVMDYVSNGGKLLFTVRPELSNSFYTIYRKLGINDMSDEYAETSGIHLKSDLLLKGTEVKVFDEIITNSSLPVQLGEGSDIHAYSEDGVPLLWSTSYGEGSLMVFNGTMLSAKLNRGLIAGSLSYLNDDFIYPILNSKVLYIDDFPAPFPEGKHDLIYKDYKRDIPTFFRDVWWPDMLSVAEKYDVKYTGVLIESYDDNTQAPFVEANGEENLKIFGRELLKMDGEIGLHGYNHQSLTDNQSQVTKLGYNAWESKEDMMEGLDEAEQYFQDLFPGYELRTYVPPSNILNELGREALLEAIPSIRILASLYHEDIESKAYVQEVEKVDGVYHLPRFSSGYHDSDDTRWQIINSATLFGAFSHFLHPDDILDEERSESKGWKEMRGSYTRLLKNHKSNYPWMESMTASESAMRLEGYAESDVYLSQQDHKIDIYINNFSGNLSFLLRTDKQITEHSNADVEKISEDRYLITAKSAKVALKLGGRK
jgi:hypothetical protein